jgi:adenylate kinase
MKWYEQEGLRHPVNGLGELDRIFSDICEVVDAL